MIFSGTRLSNNSLSTFSAFLEFSSVKTNHIRYLLQNQNRQSLKVSPTCSIYPVYVDRTQNSLDD